MIFLKHGHNYALFAKEDLENKHLIMYYYQYNQAIDNQMMLKIELTHLMAIVMVFQLATLL